MPQKNLTSTEIRKLYDAGKLIIGTDRTFKALKTGKLSQVAIASNAPEKTKKTLQHYTRISKTPVEELKISDTEIGVICKKQFSITIIGILTSHE